MASASRSARRADAAPPAPGREKPITFIARAAAPTLPAWLVPSRMKRVGSGVDIGGPRLKSRLSAAAAAPHRRRSRSFLPASPLPVTVPQVAPCRKRSTPCSTSPSRRPAARGRSSTGRRSTWTCSRSTPRAPNDFVTEVDQAAEQAIIETLLTAYPGHGILAEESGRTHGAKDSDYVWIIDPLDGTTNFIHGFPVYAVSIALAYRGQVQQAVVYDPTRNDLFYASQGPRRLPERQAPARLQAHPPGRRADRHRLPVPQGRQLQALREDVRGGDAELRRPAPPRRRRARPVLRGRRLLRRLLRDRPEPLGRGRRLADDHRGRRPDRQLHRRGRLPVPARGGGRQPEGLRPAGADAGALHARDRPDDAV